MMVGLVPIVRIREIHAINFIKRTYKKLHFSSKANNRFLGITISSLHVKQFGRRTYSAKLGKL